MAVTIGQNNGASAVSSGGAAKIVGVKSDIGADFNINHAGPQILDWLRTRLDLSMVLDSPIASRYAVSAVDASNVPVSTGSSSGGGGGVAGVISFNTRTGIVFPQKSDYSVELLSDTDIVSPAAGDMLYRNSAGDYVNLPIGATGDVLTVRSTTDLPAWETPSGGFVNPMTTDGDLIVGITAGAPARLGIGSTGYVLTVVAGAPAWAASSGGGGSGTVVAWLAL